MLNGSVIRQLRVTRPAGTSVEILRGFVEGVVRG